MSGKKLFLITLLLIIALSVIGCSKEDDNRPPYLKYVVTTYNGGQEIDKIEVYSNMGWFFNKNGFSIYNNIQEEELLFRSTLDYKLEKAKDSY